MNYDDMAHMADEERKRRREEGTEPTQKAMVSITFDKWREVTAELEQLRESEIRCREALESAEHTVRKQNAELAEARELLEVWMSIAVNGKSWSKTREFLNGSMPERSGDASERTEPAGALARERDSDSTDVAEGAVECDEHEWHFFQTEDNRQWGQRCRKCHKWQDEYVHADSAAPDDDGPNGLTFADDEKIEAMEKRVAELKEELLVAEKLLEQRQRVLNAIPDCPTHGANCVPHAIEWIHQAKTR